MCSGSRGRNASGLGLTIRRDSLFRHERRYRNTCRMYKLNIYRTPVSAPGLVRFNSGGKVTIYCPWLYLPFFTLLIYKLCLFMRLSTLNNLIKVYFVFWPEKQKSRLTDWLTDCIRKAEVRFFWCELGESCVQQCKSCKKLMTFLVKLKLAISRILTTSINSFHCCILSMNSKDIIP